MPENFEIKTIHWTGIKNYLPRKLKDKKELFGKIKYLENAIDCYHDGFTSILLINGKITGFTFIKQSEDKKNYYIVPALSIHEDYKAQGYSKELIKESTKFIKSSVNNSEGIILSIISNEGKQKKVYENYKKECEEKGLKLKTGGDIC